MFRGSLYTPEEALNIGLVDELATDKADVIGKCEKYISTFAKISREYCQLDKFDTNVERFV